MVILHECTVVRQDMMNRNVPQDCWTCSHTHHSALQLDITLCGWLHHSREASLWIWHGWHGAYLMGGYSGSFCQKGPVLTHHGALTMLLVMKEIVLLLLSGTCGARLAHICACQGGGERRACVWWIGGSVACSFEADNLRCGACHTYQSHWICCSDFHDNVPHQDLGCTCPGQQVEGGSLSPAPVVGEQWWRGRVCVVMSSARERQGLCGNVHCEGYCQWQCPKLL